MLEDWSLSQREGSESWAFWSFSPQIEGGILWQPSFGCYGEHEQLNDVSAVVATVASQANPFLPSQLMLHESAGSLGPVRCSACNHASVHGKASPFSCIQEDYSAMEKALEACIVAIQLLYRARQISDAADNDDPG